MEITADTLRTRAAAKHSVAPSPTFTQSNGRCSAGEIAERESLGLPVAGTAPQGILKQPPQTRAPVKMRAIKAPSLLNEAPVYGSAFTRGLRIELPGNLSQLLISGTASVGENGETLHPGDFRAQLWRTYRNITGLLESEGATWHDVVRTTCYIRDIERDYDEFNAVRNEFFRALGLDPFPASTAIQARICRSDLLVEIEAVALLQHGDAA
jgi:enamine deaminase RidA (YjgF/YER057c/UK114 family)